MKKVIKIILWVLLAIVAALLIIGLIAPKNFRVSKSALIKANRATVWEQVSLWKNMNNWSPWYKMDTTMKVKIEGNDGQVGAKYSWESEKMGKGSQTILESRPMDFRSSDLIFNDWGNKDTVTWELKDSADGTLVTWTIWGKNSFVGSIFGFIFGMEDMLNKNFEDGLADMKKICESQPAMAAGYTVGDVEVKTFEKRTFAAIKYSGTITDFKKNSQSIFGGSASELMAFTNKNKLVVTGTMFGMYYTWDEKADKVELEVAFPVDKEAKAEGKVHFITLNNMNCAVVDYYGPYEQSEQAHLKLGKWLETNKKENADPVMEEYVTDPGTEKDQSKWLTRVWYPLK